MKIDNSGKSWYDKTRLKERFVELQMYMMFAGRIPREQERREKNEAIIAKSSAFAHGNSNGLHSGHWCAGCQR